MLDKEKINERIEKMKGTVDTLIFLQDSEIISMGEFMKITIRINKELTMLRKALETGKAIKCKVDFCENETNGELFCKECQDNKDNAFNEDIED